MVEDLLGGHAKSPAAGGYFEPAVCIPKIALGKIRGTNGYPILVIG